MRQQMQMPLPLSDCFSDSKIFSEKPGGFPFNFSTIPFHPRDHETVTPPHCETVPLTKKLSLEGMAEIKAKF